jgi:hypothetical protein
MPSSHSPRAATVTLTFESPRSFRPSYSLLGRLFRYWTGDRLRGEALYVVALTGLALLILMTHYLGWALLKPILTGEPSWQVLFWVGQLASVALWALIGLVGVQPGVTVACTTEGLELEQGGRSHRLSHDAIEAVETVSATTYHRHYRRYAATQVFVSRLPDEVLLLRTAQGPVVVALPDPEEQDTLRRRLQTTEPEVIEEPVPQT